MLKNPFKILSGRNVSSENGDTKERIPYDDKRQGKDGDEVDFATEAFENLDISADMGISTGKKEIASTMHSEGIEKITLHSVTHKRKTSKCHTCQDLIPYKS